MCRKIYYISKTARCCCSQHLAVFRLKKWQNGNRYARGDGVKFLEWVDLTAPHWGPLSTLLGALIGAVITGLIAIIVNKDTENKRLKEKREAESKMNDILKFYLRDIKEDYLLILSLYEQYNADQYTTTQVVENANDTKEVTSRPQTVDTKTIQLMQQYVEVSKRHLANLEKLTQIDLVSIRRGDLKNFLTILSDIKQTHLPYFRQHDHAQHLNIQLDAQEIHTLIEKINHFLSL